VLNIEISSINGLEKVVHQSGAAGGPAQDLRPWRRTQCCIAQMKFYSRCQASQEIFGAMQYENYVSLT
jgi:hypothetical protein